MIVLESQFHFWCTILDMPEAAAVTMVAVMLLMEPTTDFKYLLHQLSEIFLYFEGFLYSWQNVPKGEHCLVSCS